MGIFTKEKKEQIYASTEARLPAGLRYEKPRAPYESDISCSRFSSSRIAFMFSRFWFVFLVYVFSFLF